MRTHLLVFSIIITLSHQRSIKELGEEAKSNGCSCNWRLLRHYEAKGCQATAVDNCNCPVRFDCPKANEIEENDKACHYKGVYYAPGSVINTTNPCESCRCTKGAEARVVCSSIKCKNLHVPLEPECHFLYEDTECCPSKIICDRYGSFEDHALTCEYEGRKYPLGARMFSSTDPCELCFCTKDWNNSDSSSCYQEDCVLEKYKEKLMDGCVPIYAEDVCCPIEFYCAPDDVFLSENEQIETSIEKAGFQCTFGNKYYGIGKSLSVSQGSTFMTCTCQVPPDFTCLHKACPPNPNEKNCVPYFTSDDGCPKYDCLLGTGPKSGAMIAREMEDEADADSFVFTNLENPCLDMNCTDGRSCMLYQVMCDNDTCPPVPTCMKTNTSCPTPQCSDGCVVTEQDINRCPTCVCGDDIKKRAAEMVKCRMPRCFGEGCYLVGGDDGCPICVCRRSCEVPNCRPDCNVISEHEGRCPTCVCENETEGCPTPICENESCKIESPNGGCPTCICDRRGPSNPPAEANGELEMEGSHLNSESVNFQFPQQQQQQQDFDLPAGSPFDSQSSSDDYDEISVMRRRSPPAETKTHTKNAADDQKEAETKVEHKTSNKNGSSIGNSLNTTLKKGDREP